MSEKNSGAFVNLIKKAVGLPTGSSSCCGPATAASESSCCGTAPAKDGVATQETAISCCGPISGTEQKSGSSCC